ncbi:MAG TPA: NAD(P)-dependent oxidoreductase [Terriglobia bacterium]|nr:NAD(P)-dependent oxidoreductase [Terriglobia bacterium]
MKVGWIGLGNMGLPMARNLLKAGHEVIVYNRTRSRAELLQADGARVAAIPSEVAAAPIVATMVADDSALEDIIFGSGKVLATLAPGAIHVSMSTISVVLSKRLAEAHAKAGQVYVSAPVFGRPEAAVAAKIFVVACGPGDSVRACQPLFDAVGQHTFVMGDDAPVANVIKLAGNFLIASTIETLGEAFALVRKYGVSPQQFLDFLTTSLFTAPVHKTYGTLIAEDKYQPVGFKVPLGLKDVKLVLAAAESASVPLPVANLIHDRFVTLIARGMQESDWATIARLSAENAGLKPDTTIGN